MEDSEARYVREIVGLFQQIGSKFPLIGHDSLQFLFWFMWINFDWGRSDSSEVPKEVVDSLCDNANDQSVDGFYFDDDTVYAIQSKYTRDWRSPDRVTYGELKRTADIRAYFDTGDPNSMVFRRANSACRKLLLKARKQVIEDGCPLRIILVTNKLEPTETNLKKLYELNVDIDEDNFEIIAKPKLVQLWAQFLEGHNPPIPRYFIETVDDKYLYLPTPKNDLEAYVAITTAEEVRSLYDKYGDRIFEKNVRSFLGNIFVNNEIAETLKRDPEMFFYRNSGLTILCTRADPVPGKHGAKPGFWVTDVQIINGQQTTRRLADNPRASTHVLLTIIGPYKTESSTHTPNTEQRRDMTTRIIAARNFQSKVSYADLKANHPTQVAIWRAFRDRGYYYERKRKAWTNMNQYARTLYSLACKESWAQVKKERLAAETLAIIDDPQRPYQGSDYIFREQYDRIFNLRRFSIDYYIALHLLSTRYVYRLGYEQDDTYPLYHVLRFLVDDIHLSKSNAARIRQLLEEPRIHRSLRTATKILYQLCNLLIRDMQGKSEKIISSSAVFGKQKGVLKKMKRFFRSKAFARPRKKYNQVIDRFKTEIRT